MSSHAPDGAVALPAPAAWIAKTEQTLGIAVALVAAAILLFEVGLLFVGVVARYFLHRPLIWADELASTLFVWLSVLGAVLAMRRNAHMRLTTFIGRASPRLITMRSLPDVRTFESVPALTCVTKIILLAYARSK